MASATPLPARPPTTPPATAPTTAPTGPAAAPAAAPVAAPPTAAPTPAPTGCAPGSPVIGSRLESVDCSFTRFGSDIGEVPRRWEMEDGKGLFHPLCK